MKKERLIKLVIAFALLFLLIFLCVRFLSKGYTNSYKIKNKFKVNEVYTKDEANERNNYYITIEVNDLVFDYQFYRELENNNKIVKDVLYYDGEYKCMMPIFKNDLKVDFHCYKDNVFYNYIDVVGKDEELDKYIKSLSKDIYDINMFKDNTSDSKEKERIKYYEKNIPNNYIISLTTLKGITNINNGEVKTIDLFDSDSYKRDLSIYTNNYYISADYTERQNFRNVYIVNIIDGKEKIVKAPDYISFNAYIQGVVDNGVYIYDMTNEKQYKLDLDNNEITLIGNTNNGIRYYHGAWDNITTLRANNKVLFTNTDEEIKDYEYYYKHGNKLSGFYYYFKEVDNGYEVYKANVQSPQNIKYLFTVTNYQKVLFEDDYVFYKENDSIKMYSDYTGIKTLITTSELEFNSNIIFNVYNNG